MKLSVKGNRDKYIGIAFLTLAAYSALSTVSNVITGSLAWKFASTQRTIVTPMMYNRPFSADSRSGDTSAMAMFANSFTYLRLTVSPETIDSQQKTLLSYVPAESRDNLKKVLDVEAERIKKSGITTRFEVSEIREVEPGVMEVSGKLSSSTTNGNISTPMKDLQKNYRLEMSYENGLIRLRDFRELIPATTP
ncbi:MULTISPECIES: TraE/TraK family type IV conjugative transfer system protein [Enterobacteriaceae]|uniref:TraE/TraK family type IV conjugative transfer system protein n=1 Tax=Enterobacteriaceae TaxID=543 RepID=UPI000497E022|nr:MULTISPECIES: TraE/TraK family type IV conjugative transfer system protein [Enterobacteriaceae]EGT4277884.1 conjugal transfer protein TraE [Cronobacter sakazakii]EGT5186016.1 conjugal transfer protein TraE [Cronobacter sakazakii]EGT5666951.1 conjugal transfer protein TraE [Cronobacter sakazakii]EGT5763983.1 conjugal transfer protein TraE [Cronobacter sakazakii]EGZ7002402.1 conjugal transfer protein TraE [Cronobacter sakazakii]